MIALRIYHTNSAKKQETTKKLDKFLNSYKIYQVMQTLCDFISCGFAALEKGNTSTIKFHRKQKIFVVS